MEVVAGDAAMLGATPVEGGVNFALSAAHADVVELCVFDETGEHEATRLALPGRDGDVWHGFVPSLGAGVRYGYRVHGPYAPELGHRHNPNKLLLDPYARRLSGEFRWHASHFGFKQGGQDDEPDDQDNAAFMPRGVVCAALADLPVGPRTAWADTVIFEAHLRGFTQRHPLLSERERGVIRGLAADAIVDYLVALGITAIELLPVHAFINEAFHEKRELSNYWGYNTLSWFAVHPPYLAGEGPEAFQRVINRLHDAGLEVVLDVVYNHSCEGGADGPTLSLRGIDNASYYRLERDDPAQYVNDTGCGNTLAADQPVVRRLVLDSLRYWAKDMGIDGFRFDLGATLGRSVHGFDPHAALLSQIGADPLLGKCKLIAEPWDIGPGGYRLGGFPRPFREWNDRYRDSVRRYWRGDDGELPELARRLHGSGDIFENAQRPASSSINLVTSHDGFTLRDLVSYARRHNLANREDNRDGHAENFSDNGGVEGSSTDAAILERRALQQRNMLATLVLSQGVPMISGGDEVGRTQQGNNNAYCQDNEISWTDWENTDDVLLAFARGLIALRKDEPLLRADRYRHDEPDADGQSLHWIDATGKPAPESFWLDPGNACVGCLLASTTPDSLAGRQLLILLNAGAEAVDFALPEHASGGDWAKRMDTRLEPWIFSDAPPAESSVTVLAHSMMLLDGSGRLNFNP